jgi:hypothetical protein
VAKSDFVHSQQSPTDLLKRCWWLTPIILATQEAEIRRITVQNQPQQTVCKTLSQTKPSEKRAGEVAQVVGP